MITRRYAGIWDHRNYDHIRRLERALEVENMLQENGKVQSLRISKDNVPETKGLATKTGHRQVAFSTVEDVRSEL
jgi:hypothetical protein